MDETLSIIAEINELISFNNAILIEVKAISDNCEMVLAETAAIIANAESALKRAKNAENT